MFARLSPSHCHGPGFLCTLPASHHLASPCSQSCHTIQKAFLMKCISSKQLGTLKSGPYLFFPSFKKLRSYKEMPSSTKMGIWPPCPSYLPASPYSCLLSLEDCETFEGKIRKIFVFTYLQFVPSPRRMPGICKKKTTFQLTLALGVVSQTCSGR